MRTVVDPMKYFKRWCVFLPFILLPHCHEAFQLLQHDCTSSSRAILDGLHRLNGPSCAARVEPETASITSLKPKSTTRRQSILSGINTLATVFLAPSITHAGLFAEKPKRQLELCIVSLIRILYWAEKATKDLRSESPDVRKQRYLEVRLASKALVTGKLGGGANYQVYTLNTLQLKECLSDLVSYAEEMGGKADRRKAQDLQTELIECLASIVEFDGLETTLDPSPRSSLTMTMYTRDKGTFVRRSLSEKVVPTTKALIRLFGPEVENRCVAYVQKTYPEELPVVEEPASKALEGGTTTYSSV